MMDVPNDANDEMDVDAATDDSIQLMDFPNEVLLRMFQHFNDTHLLDMARVCTRFEAIASETFAKRYNGETEDSYFKVFCVSDGDEDEVIYLPIFETFGKGVTALEISIKSTVKFSSTYWLYRFIRDYCTSASITHVIVRDANDSFNYQHFRDSLPAITHLTFVKACNNKWANCRYEHVINFRARNFRRIGASAVRQFVANHPQLQSLEFKGRFTGNPLPEFSGKLNQLESLVLDPIYCMPPIQLTEVVFEQLKSLTISMDHYSASNELQAIERGCKQIEYLEVAMLDDWEDDDGTRWLRKRLKVRESCHFCALVRVVGTFNQLKSFNLNRRPYLKDSFEILIEHLPKSLTALSLKLDDIMDKEIDHNNVLSIFTTFEDLRKLSLTLIASCVDKCKLFSLDWCREFGAIGANRKHAIRYVFNDRKIRAVVTKDKCSINGELRYWVGYEPDRSHSKTHILDLNEKCINKILDWLPDDEVCNVYRTCTALKKVAAERVQSMVLHFSDHEISKLESLADDIRRLEINKRESDGWIEMLTLVRDRCSKNLIEFQISTADTKLMDDLNLSFPNLEKLTVGNVASADGKVLPTMNCPKLKHLEIRYVDFGLNIQKAHLGLSIDNLTVLKFQYFDVATAKPFTKLSDKIYLQLKEFTVVDAWANADGLLNVVSRFRNLVELNLVYAGVEHTNTVYLFERCSKLVKLTLGYHKYSADMERLLKNCKKNCEDLKVIQLIRPYREYEFDEKICQFISDELPNVELYKVIPLAETTAGKPKCKITRMDQSFGTKICDRPY